MKKLILTLSLFVSVLGVQAQSKSIAKLKEKYKNHNESFQMELGGNFMNFADGFKINMDKNDMATVAKSIEKLIFFTLPEGAQALDEYKALQIDLNKENYDLILEAAEGKGGVRIYSKGTTTLSDLVILVGEEKNGGLIVVELKGNFTQEMLETAKSQIN